MSVSTFFLALAGLDALYVGAVAVAECRWRLMQRRLPKARVVDLSTYRNATARVRVAGRTTHRRQVP